MTIIALHNQTLWDIAIRYFGTANAAFEIALLNNLPVTAELEVGALIKLPVKDFGYRNIVNYFQAKNDHPATAWNQDLTVLPTKLEGIGYWAISVDFEVQADGDLAGGKMPATGGYTSPGETTTGPLEPSTTPLGL